MRNEIQRIIESHSIEDAAIIIELLIEKEKLMAKINGAIEQNKKDCETIKSFNP